MEGRTRTRGRGRRIGARGKRIGKQNKIKEPTFRIVSVTWHPYFPHAAAMFSATTVPCGRQEGGHKHQEEESGRSWRSVSCGVGSRIHLAVFCHICLKDVSP